MKKSKMQWLKPKSKRTKYHAYVNVDGKLLSLCKTPGSDITGGYIGLDAMGVDVDTLLNRFDTHCCKKCITSYNYQNRRVTENEN